MANYQLAISNIAWLKDDDEAVYTAMQQAGFTGLELAPTRIFSEAPYENLTSALLFGGYLKNRWGFSVPSLQSIWYGQKGNIFNPADTEPLLDYTAQAFQFAHSLNCPSLVFGCPKNRMRPLGGNDAAAEAFFVQAGNLAARYGVHLALEANPPMYTNYLNNTADAFALVKRLDNPGLSVNFDLSTVLARARNCKLSSMICSMSATFISASRAWPPSRNAPSTGNWRCCWGRWATAVLSPSRWPTPTWTRSAARWTILRRCSHDRVRAQKSERRAGLHRRRI